MEQCISSSGIFYIMVNYTFVRSVLPVDKFSASDLHDQQFMTLQLHNFSGTYLVLFISGPSHQSIPLKQPHSLRPV
jgi:hypothetical protein